MANAIERRLSALETLACPAERSLTVVFLEAGEDEADGLMREGYSLEAKDVICVSFVSPRARTSEEEEPTQKSRRGEPALY